MDRQEFEELTAREPDHRIHARTFMDEPGGFPRRRTLLYGYTCDRNTFHVYLKDGYIHRLVYREGAHDVTILEYDWFKSWDPERLVPDKRVYPESTSALLGRLLKDAGVGVPYRKYDDNEYERVRYEVFHGMTREEFG